MLTFLDSPQNAREGAMVMGGALQNPNYEGKIIHKLIKLASHLPANNDAANQVVGGDSAMKDKNQSGVQGSNMLDPVNHNLNLLPPASTVPPVQPSSDGNTNSRHASATSSQDSVDLEEVSAFVAREHLSDENLAMDS